jgi:translin
VTDARRVESAVEATRQQLQAKYEARERALQLSREATRLSANSIRAVHRGELDRAWGLRQQAGATLAEARHALRDHQDIYYAGFVVDAQKEYAEACLMLALLRGEPLPAAGDVGVESAAWLNGLAEAASELRRIILDRLRSERLDGCEELLDAMDDVYSALITVDYPDGMTGGLRRTTDMLRGVLEKTRGDLTVALREQAMARRLEQVEQRLAGGQQDKG